MRSTILVLTVAMLVSGVFASAFRIQPVSASGTIYIRADGSIDPSTASITSVNNITYTLTDDIFDSVIIERDNIVLNGNRYTLQGPGSGNGIGISERSNVTITDAEVTGFFGGIWVSNSTNIVITGNNVTNSELGIILEHSLTSNITGNTITTIVSSHTRRPKAILLSSNNSVVSRNQVHIVDGTYDVAFGIYLGNNSFNCLIDGNDILGPQIMPAAGIALEDCQSITLRRNTISGTIATGGIGIITDVTCRTLLIIENVIRGWFWGMWPASPSAPSGNLAYHNDFADNYDQVFEGMLQSAWAWDDSYPSGGNHWSDYAGADLYSGPHQNETGSDGLGDTPYLIGERDADNYPLMKPYPWAPHDIGVTGLAASKTAVGQGYAVHVNVTLFNYGNNTEHFNVTVSANTTLVHTFDDVTLTSRNSLTLAFTWSTSGFVKGSYTLTAVADPVLGETDITDNTRAGDQVIVTLPGDVNGDQRVDIFDIVRMAGGYGTTPPNPKYDPNCDIDGDGDIDIFDIVIAADNYGQEW